METKEGGGGLARKRIYYWESKKNFLDAGETPA